MPLPRIQRIVTDFGRAIFVASENFSPIVSTWDAIFIGVNQS